jgi:hypothetical protein
MRSRIEPMKKIARSLRQHRELILNYFRAQKLLSSGVVEGLTQAPEFGVFSQMEYLRITGQALTADQVNKVTWFAKFPAPQRLLPHFPEAFLSIIP